MILCHLKTIPMSRNFLLALPPRDWLSLRLKENLRALHVNTVFEGRKVNWVRQKIVKAKKIAYKHYRTNIIATAFVLEQLKIFIHHTFGLACLNKVILENFSRQLDI